MTTGDGLPPPGAIAAPRAGATDPWILQDLLECRGAAGRNIACSAPRAALTRCRAGFQGNWGTP